MEIGARLHHIELLAQDTASCAAFYARALGMTAQAEGARHVCQGNDCRLIVSPGSANHCGFVAFAFAEPNDMRAYRQLIEARIALSPAETPFLANDAFGVTDPDGNRVVFGRSRTEAHSARAAQSSTLPARLQHYAIRSAQPEVLVAFYRDVLGFVISDRVFDEDGVLRACFFRTDEEHHALAIFTASAPCLDHISFDTQGWSALRDWADHLSGLHVPLVWGIGRHGPGNDVFFMVRDPEGNLVEWSSELEVCARDRPEGRWAHEERTLNLWGRAILRS